MGNYDRNMAGTRFGRVARQLGPNSIGMKIEIALARAGAILTSQATIAARKTG